MQRQDIKIMIDRLDNEISHSNDPHCINLAIDMLEELGNLVAKLQYDLDASNRKIEDLERLVLTDTESFAKAYSDLQEKKSTLKEYYESVFNDGAIRIRKLMQENAKLKQDILQLEAMIED